MKAVGTRAEVMHGTASHTAGGLTKKKLKVSKVSGEIVSKKKATAGDKNPWAAATAQARLQLGLTGKEQGRQKPGHTGKMVLMNVGKDGKALYALTKQIYGA